MNTNIKTCTIILASVLLLSACESKKNAAGKHDHTDSADMAHHSADSMGGTVMDTMSSATNGLMTAMNTMMDKMSGVPMTTDFDVDFANMMIEHHKGAIEMSNIELSKGTDTKMKSMAQDIITEQKNEINMLQDAIKNHKNSGMKHGEGLLQKSMEDMKAGMKSMQMTANLDKDFATMMISHHQSAVKMSKDAVPNLMDAGLKKMAQKTITDQTKEIGEFRNWLASYR